MFQSIFYKVRSQGKKKKSVISDANATVISLFITSFPEGEKPSSQYPQNIYIFLCVISHSVVPTPCDPMACSLQGSSVHGIFLSRILEWVAISFFRVSSQPRDQTHASGVSCIGRCILYHWATWEAHTYLYNPKTHIK